MKLKEIAKALNISTNAVRNAIDDGRITSFSKSKAGYEFDPDRAIQEYLDNTNPNLSRNSLFDDEDDEERGSQSDGQPASVLDVDPKYWTANEAIQAKTIYQALKVKHELEVQEGKFYPKDEADREFTRVSQAFARGLLSLPAKMKQRHGDLTDAQLSDLKKLCSEIVEESESKI